MYSSNCEASGRECKLSRINYSFVSSKHGSIVKATRPAFLNATRSLLIRNNSLGERITHSTRD